MNKIHRLFVGIYTPDSFNFRKGDIVLILEVASFVRSKYECNGCTVHEFFSQINDAVKRTPTVRTLIGELFCDDICTIQTAVESRFSQNSSGSEEEAVENQSPAQSVHSINENALDPNSLPKVKDAIFAKKILVESCLEQIKSVLREFFQKNSDEEAFMVKCGFATLDELIIDIKFDESELQYFLTAENDKQLKASINCYCSDATKPSKATLYFRANYRWSSMTPGNIPTGVSKELAKSWNIGNFKRHLTSHKKKFEASKCYIIRECCIYFDVLDSNLMFWAGDDNITSHSDDNNNANSLTTSSTNERGDIENRFGQLNCGKNHSEAVTPNQLSVAGDYFGLHKDIFSKLKFSLLVIFFYLTSAKISVLSFIIHLICETFYSKFTRRYQLHWSDRFNSCA